MSGNFEVLPCGTQARLAQAEAERDALRANYSKVCKLVADMHASATGRPGEGPRLGVIEDVTAVRVERDALLSALKLARSIIGHPYDAHSQMIDAAIDAAMKGGGNG